MPAPHSANRINQFLHIKHHGANSTAEFRTRETEQTIMVEELANLEVSLEAQLVAARTALQGLAPPATKIRNTQQFRDMKSILKQKSDQELRETHAMFLQELAQSFDKTKAMIENMILRLMDMQKGRQP